MSKILLPSLESTRLEAVSLRIGSETMMDWGWFLRLVWDWRLSPDFQARTLLADLILAAK
jgi:hypothetical protein